MFLGYKQMYVLLKFLFITWTHLECHVEFLGKHKPPKNHNWLLSKISSDRYNKVISVELFFSLPSRFFIFCVFVTLLVRKVSSTAVPTFQLTLSPTSKPMNPLVQFPSRFPSVAFTDVHDIDLSFLAPGQGVGISSPSDSFLGGYTLCNLGDYDLDGFSDLAIGVPKYNASTGAIFVISGRFNTTKSSSLVSFQ